MTDIPPEALEAGKDAAFSWLRSYMEDDVRVREMTDDELTEVVSAACLAMLRAWPRQFVVRDDWIKGGRMIERMTEAEIAELNVRRINRDGTAEVLCTKAFHEITALRAEVASKNEQFQQYARKMETDIDALAAQNEKLRAALDILQKAMTAKKPIPMAFKKAIIEARAALGENTNAEA